MLYFIIKNYQKSVMMKQGWEPLVYGHMYNKILCNIHTTMDVLRHFIIGILHEKEHIFNHRYLFTLNSYIQYHIDTPTS